MSETKPSLFTQLNEWYQQPLGQALAHTIEEQLRPCLSHFFGYHLLQLGVPDFPQWVQASPIAHKMCVLPDLAIPAADGADNVFAPFDALPFVSASIDVVVLPHILAFMPNPQAVIAEVERVLVPEGHVIIIGFNPLSLWGTGRLLLQFKRQAPWCGQFISTMKLRRYLDPYGLQITHLQSFFFRPPVSSPLILERLLFLEALGRISWPYPGGAYIAVAKKQVARLAKIKPLWRFRNLVVGKQQTIQPTTRGHTPCP